MRPLAALLLSAAVASAGPLPWSYSVTFKGVADTQTILLGKETWSEYDHNTGAETNTDYYLLLDVGAGWTKTGTIYPGITEEPWGFGHGDWRLSETLPTEPYSANQFVVTLMFTDADGNVGYTSPQLGSIYAMGLRSGTGNFTIGLEGTQLVGLGNDYANVTFGTRESESYNRVTFTVEETTVPEVPEPASLLLGGLAAASGVGAWVRRKLARGG